MSADTLFAMERPISLFDTPALSAETSLVDDCKKGNPRALRALYEQHRASVYRITARMLDNEADREEVVQEVFLQVFRSIHRFKGRSKLNTWVHRVAMNVILQHIRKKKHRVQLHLAEDPPDDRAAASFQLSPEEGAINGEKRAAVQRALSALSPKKRSVLVLHDFEGVSAKEIAGIVKASVITVRTRLFYARDAFYASLSKDPAFVDVIAPEGTGS